MRLLYSLLLIVASTLILVGYWSGYMIGWWQPLTRPAGVPRAARFVNTWESQMWFDCSYERTRDVDVCRAWFNGRLIADGDFRLEGTRRAATPSELNPSVTGRTLPDGTSDEIWLFGPNRQIQGRLLVRVHARK
jgi:hypothetical protein